MFIRKVFVVLKVLWAGSLWSLAAWVAPTLFHAQPDRHLAGILAAGLFGIETYVGIARRAARLGAARRPEIPVGIRGGGAARRQRMGPEAGHDASPRARAPPRV